MEDLGLDLVLYELYLWLMWVVDLGFNNGDGRSANGREAGYGIR